MIAPGQALPRVHMMICCPGQSCPGTTVAHKGQCNKKWFAANKKDRMQTKKDRMQTKKIGADTVTWNVLQTSNYDPEVVMDLADGPNWPRLHEI